MEVAHTPTYADVAPLFATSRVTGNNVEYVFRCPATGAEFVGTATVATQQTKAFMDFSPQTLAREDVRNRAEVALDRAAPHARLALDLAGGLFQWRRQKRKLENPSPAPPPDQAAAADAQKHAEQMMLDAFATVVDKFRWDGARWVSASV
jgi:hypothetical protein